MNKTQLVDALAERLGDRRAAATAVEGLLETIVDAVRSGDSVSLTGFGVFEGRARAARTARNPRTGEAVAVPATTVPAFRPGAAFRSAVGDGAGAPAPRSTPTRSRATAAAAEPDAAAATEKPVRRKATPKTTPKTSTKASTKASTGTTQEATPEVAPEVRARTAKVGSSFAAPAGKTEKAEKAAKAEKNGSGKVKPAAKSSEKPGKENDKGKKAKGKK